MLKLVKFPNNILREPINAFDFYNPEWNPEDLEKVMIDFMFEHNGIGLAANQIGIKARVFVMGHKDSPQLAQAFFNPQVVEASDEIDDLEEGCLSFPGVFVKVKRPKEIKALWQDKTGQFRTGNLIGYDCKCFLHELDHLEGIVYKDRVSNLKWSLANKRIKN